MLLGRVMGNVVSTRKDHKLTGYKLLLIKPFFDGDSRIYVAADQLGAGVGELVLIAEDSAVRYGIEKEAPIDALVVGIVDSEPELV